MARARVGVLLAVLAGVGVLLLRPRAGETAEAGVGRGIAQFVDGVNTWNIRQAINALSPDFKTGGEVRRGDVSRWFVMARHDWDRLTIYVAAKQITVAADGQTATADCQITMSGRRKNGREESVGEDKPVQILSYWQRDGRRWICYGAENVVGSKLDAFWFE